MRLNNFYVIKLFFMFFKKDNFETKNLWKIQVKAKKNKFSLKSFFRWFFVWILLFIVFYFWNSISLAVSNYIKQVAWTVISNLTKVVSNKPKSDNLWNVNILLLWIWGKNHDGGYLTDSMMIASFNPKLDTLTFLSIPRDLYVKYPWGGGWRINYIFAREYLRTGSFSQAAKVLEEKIKQITGIGINYYVLIDFWGFERFIDSIGGITVNVPKTLIDYRYPGPNRTYTTFKITKWIHHLDGATALKYARSRHSTSDFSRSARQEQIIKAIIHKLLTEGYLFSPIKLKNLYLQFQDTVKTDMDFNTMLSFVPYVKNIKIHSYVLNGDCYYKNVTRKELTPGCFVYPAVRADFNGQAVLLPVGATPDNVENYTYIRRFAFIVLDYPELWLENAKIQILNGINKRLIKKYYRYYKPVASELAYKLKNYGFNIVDVGNANKFFEKNTDFIYNKKPVTQDLLQTFVGDIIFKTGDVKYAWSGYDMTLILGNDYLQNNQITK